MTEGRRENKVEGLAHEYSSEDLKCQSLFGARLHFHFHFRPRVSYQLRVRSVGRGKIKFPPAAAAGTISKTALYEERPNYFIILAQQEKSQSHFSTPLWPSLQILLLIMLFKMVLV